MLGAAEIRELAAKLDVTPTKKLGQNFVHDANTVRRIVQLADLEPASRVLEIGPGLGSLTLGLLESGHPVTAVEIDGRLATELPTTASRHAPDAALTVITKDALEIAGDDGAAADGSVATALVANLPYNVSVPVFLTVLERMPAIDRALVMVQAEVGERLAAKPGSKVYGAPSVKSAWYGDSRIASRVSREVFWPVPNVDSVLVAFRRAERVLPDGADAEAVRRDVFALVDAGFQQRRKMLRQSLSGVLGDSATASARLEAAGVAPTARAEELAIDAWIAIALAA